MEPRLLWICQVRKYLDCFWISSDNLSGYSNLSVPVRGILFDLFCGLKFAGGAILSVRKARRDTLSPSCAQRLLVPLLVTGVLCVQAKWHLPRVSNAKVGHINSLYLDKKSSYQYWNHRGRIKDSQDIFWPNCYSKQPGFPSKWDFLFNGVRYTWVISHLVTV